MKKIILLLSVVTVAGLSLTGCSSMLDVLGEIENQPESGYENNGDIRQETEDEKVLEEDYNTWEEKEEENDLEEEEEKKEEESNSENLSQNARKGTVTSPVKQGNVGIITTSCYNASSGEADLYVKVEKTIKGKEAEKLVDDHNADSIIQMTYDSSKEDVYATKILIDTENYVTYKNSSATPPRLKFNITDTDGNGITYNGTKYIISGVFFAVTESMKQGDIVEAYWLYSLPKGYEGDYLIEANENSWDSNSYFLLKTKDAK